MVVSPLVLGAHGRYRSGDIRRPGLLSLPLASEIAVYSQRTTMDAVVSLDAFGRRRSVMTHDGGLRLRMQRVLRAPRSAVFHALTDPQELAKWFGPDGYTIPRVESDLRPGGGYRIAMQPPEGDLFYLVGEFLEVAPPERLSYTFRWEDPDPEDRETVVTLSLREVDGNSTELGFVQGDFATERRQALHEEGWTQSFGKLEELLSSAALA